eukprot:symbB.v1.2.034338.t1/scaffold4415.1/size39987/2
MSTAGPLLRFFFFTFVRSLGRCHNTAAALQFWLSWQVLALCLICQSFMKTSRTKDFVSDDRGSRHLANPSSAPWEANRVSGQIQAQRVDIWSAGPITGWLELRPANIAWHSQYGVGAWHLWTDQRHGHQLVIFLQQREDQGHRSFVREELRYTMEYRDGSNPPIFEEQYDTRKILRPLGFTVEGPHFGTLPRVKLEAHAPAYKDPSEPGDASCTDVAKEKSTQELLVEWGDDWADNLKIQIQGRCGYRILTREGSRLREESAGELEKIPTEHDFPLRIRFEASESEKPQSTFASTGGDARAKLSYLLQPKGASSQPKAKETEPKEPSPTTATAEGTEEAVEGT